MSDMGHYVLSVADFPSGAQSASFIQWAPLDHATQLMDLMRNGGFRRLENPEPRTSPLMASSRTPQLFSACNAATLGDAGNAELSDPNTIIMEWRTNWGPELATQFERVSGGAEGDTPSLLQHVDEVVSKCDTCQAFEKALHIPITGTLTVSTLTERPQLDRPFLDDIIALRTMDVLSKYSLLTRVRSGNPLEAWDVPLSSWVGAFGTAKCLHLDKGGVWNNDLWRDLCVERCMKSALQGVGAHPWIVERRNGLARDFCSRQKEDRYYMGLQLSRRCSVA